jgi:hypothetical protein
VLHRIRFGFEPPPTTEASGSHHHPDRPSEEAPLGILEVDPHVVLEHERQSRHV